VKDFTAKQREIVTAAQKVKGDEQNKLWDKYEALGKDYADRFLQVAEADPKGDTGFDALLWIVQNAADTPAHKTATERVQARVAEMPLKALAARLTPRVQATPALLATVLKRAEADEKDPAAGDLVAWAATSGYFLPGGEKAIRRLVEKYPDNPAVERVCAILGRGMKGGEDMLRQILDKAADKPKVKVAATFALGQLLASQADKATDKAAGDKLAAEAEKFLTAAVELYPKNDKATERQRASAEGELRALRTLRVGMVAPEITAPDLDKKEFKLSDYRGKVVMLDFWGNW